jgi:hypothetical protein
MVAMEKLYRIVAQVFSMSDFGEILNIIRFNNILMNPASSV